MKPKENFNLKEGIALWSQSKTLQESWSLHKACELRALFSSLQTLHLL